MIRKIIHIRHICLLLLLCAGLPAYGQSNRQLKQNSPAAELKGEKRLALVIGNGAYAESPLRNPVNDANDMATALKNVGFEVISFTNLDQNGMKRAIRDFGTRLRTGGGVGLFYYAGHGVQSKGRNYLIPVGANVSTEEEVEYESVEVGLLLAQMESAKNALNIVILDACRNNPFARSFRSAEKGLASIDAPSGTLIAYSTAPGSVASDGAGRNGVYTQELLKQLETADLTVEEVFKRVRSSVNKQTSGKQIPWESTSLVNDFYFSGQKAGSVIKRTKAVPDMEPPITIPAPAISNRIVNEGFFTFELKRCSKSGTVVACELSITNKDKIDKLFEYSQFYPGKLFDNEGNETSISSWFVGNRSTEAGRRVTILPEIQTRSVVRVERVSPAATSIRRLELNVVTCAPDRRGLCNWEYYLVKFENVDFE